MTRLSGKIERVYQRKFETMVRDMDSKKYGGCGKRAPFGNDEKK